MDNQKIGQYIKQKRKEKKLTQQQLGDLVGVSFKAVSKWECGNSIPDISILKKVCKVLEISIEELLDGNDKNKLLESNTKKRIFLIISILVALILLITIILTIIFSSPNKNKGKDFSDGYDCTLTKTYNVDNINSSNDSNYLYITFKEYQVEGVYTIKLSKTISKDLEIGKNYEFTFNTYKEYISSTPTEIFEKSELINIESSDKVGIEQKNEFNCK